MVTHETRFVYDGNQIVLQFDTNGGGEMTAADLSHRYLWRPATDQFLSDEQVTSVNEPGTVVLPLTDNLGTVRDLAICNLTTGTTSVVNHLDYTAFGQVLSQTNPATGNTAAVDCLFGFTGEAYDQATGLQNNGFRWYNAGLGRWESPDPTEFTARDTNEYRYVGNSPANAVDPRGEAEIIDWQKGHNGPGGSGASAYELWSGVKIWRDPVHAPLTRGEYIWTIPIPWTNSQFFFRNVSMNPFAEDPRDYGNYVGGYTGIVPREQPVVSKRTDAIATGVYKGAAFAGVTTVATVAVLAVVPEALLTNGVVVLTGKVLLVLGVYEAGTGAYQAVAVLIDKDATPKQVEEAIYNSTVNAGIVLPLAYSMRRTLFNIGGRSIVQAGAEISRLLKSATSSLGADARAGSRFSMRNVRFAFWDGPAPVRPNSVMPRGREFRELSHTYIPQRGWGTNVPDFIKNRGWNLKPLWGSEHALVDLERYQFMPRTWRLQNPPPGPVSRLWGRMPVSHRVVVVVGAAGAGGTALYYILDLGEEK